MRPASGWRGGRGVDDKVSSVVELLLDTDNQWVNVANPIIVGEEQDAPVAAANEDFSHHSRIL